MVPEIENPVEEEGAAPEIVLPGQGEPFVEPVAGPRAGPTEAQQAWMQAHPQHARMSHVRNGRFHTRGTLTADGHFIPESGNNPVIDGGGSFGVGIPHRR